MCKTGVRGGGSEKAKKGVIMYLNSPLLDPTIDKNSNPTVLRTCALETIDTYHEIPIQAYTDGSALNGTTSAGCGAILKFPNGPDIEISKAIGKS